LLAGYLETMIFDFIENRKLEVRIEAIAKVYYPASLAVQTALGDFEEQASCYAEAVMYGESDFLTVAQKKADNALKSLKYLCDQKLPAMAEISATGNGGDFGVRLEGTGGKIHGSGPTLLFEIDVEQRFGG